MRFVSSLFTFVVLAALAGCGGKSGPVKPAEVTAEQERQLKEEQQRVDSAERQQMAQQPKALTPEQQVEMQERARQGR